MRACFSSWSSQRFAPRVSRSSAKNNAITRGCETNDRRIVLVERLRQSGDWRSRGRFPHAVDRKNRKRLPAGPGGAILALSACAAVATLPHAHTEAPPTALLDTQALPLTHE